MRGVVSTDQVLDFASAAIIFCAAHCASPHSIRQAPSLGDRHALHDEPSLAVGEQFLGISQFDAGESQFGPWATASQ
jgi:hypothetical protein